MALRNGVEPLTLTLTEFRSANWANEAYVFQILKIRFESGGPSWIRTNDVSNVTALQAAPLTS